MRFSASAAFVDLAGGAGLAVLAAGMTLLALGLAGFTRPPVHGSYAVDVLPASLVFAIGLPAAFAGVGLPVNSGEPLNTMATRLPPPTASSGFVFEHVLEE